MVRFANTYGPNDWNGAETGALLRSWPKQLPNQLYPRPPHEGEYGGFSTSSWATGSKILCRADQSYTHPDGFNIAGQSKRITSFYRKTGVSEHRSEPGFRDTKGGCTYTEINAAPTASPMSTFRSPFENTASLVLTRTARERLGTHGGPFREAGSQGGSVHSRRSMSQKSAPNSGKMFSGAGTSGRGKADWDWDPLPMYHTCNQLYGSQTLLDPTDPKATSAGKSWSGFLTPTKLQKALKNPGECIAPKV